MIVQKLLIMNCKNASVHTEKYIFVIIMCLFVFLSSCKKYKNCNDEYTKILTNCNKLYWDVQSKDGNGLYGCYRFDIDGSCYFFKYNQDFERKFFIDDDIREGANWWNIINKDTISFQGGIPYEILYLSKDTIKVKPIMAERIMILTHTKNQEDHLDFDTIKNNKRKYMYFDRSKVIY